MGASSLALRMNSCQSGATTRVWPCHPRPCRLAARARARSVRSIEEKPTRRLAIWVRSTCARSKVMLSLLCLAKGVRRRDALLVSETGVGATVTISIGGEAESIDWDVVDPDLTPHRAEWRERGRGESWPAVA